jgi:hypothetical protein
LAQDQARPVERAEHDPRGLHARALGGFDFHRAPLLPQRRRRERGHQRHREHGREQRRAARPGPRLLRASGSDGQFALRGLQRWALARVLGVHSVHDLPPPSKGLAQSRVIWPASACPGLGVSSRRTPSGMAEVAVVPGVPKSGRPAAPGLALTGAVAPLLESGFDQALPRK